MGRFLDLRISENSSLFGFPDIAVSTTPELIGVIGLQTQNVAGTGTNGLIVHLSGTVGVTADAVGTVVLNVQRGATTVFGGGDIIYTAVAGVVTTLTGADVISFTASDINAPAAAQTEYTLFISVPTTEAIVTRVGPENFVGIAQDGLASTP
ncbi:hypothetical protein [Paenibacillus popilliae]|uniref:NADPH-dependent glutamate synthase n=1 Tax=Paenibacillus popilliae ATCC 14706 TaxID=1212764 RepID=M9LD18_PAEPP|nr:hypothetical protein [Paenibacillus popilliae]GAC44152.1 NADPH-dependent glutamate synthase [Paenibacillus popilliae ATCC 14706]